MAGIVGLAIGVGALWRRVARVERIVADRPAMLPPAPCPRVHLPDLPIEWIAPISARRAPVTLTPTELASDADEV